MGSDSKDWLVISDLPGLGNRVEPCGVYPASEDFPAVQHVLTETRFDLTLKSIATFQKSTIFKE
jgi:hypothetical protein